MKQFERFNFGRMTIGLIFIGFGAVMLLTRLDILYLDWHWTYWPLIFIIIGLVKIGNATQRHDLGDGIWWLFIGSWLFVSVNHVWGLSFHNSWPILLIALGIRMIYKSLFVRRPYISEIHS
jgi:hypothetical protein